jgi:hypothetical protein
MKGEGFGPVPDPNHPGRENFEWFADDEMTQEEADRLNGVLPQQSEEAMRQFREENERTNPMLYAPTVPTKQEYLDQEARKAYEAEFNNAIEDYEDEMDTLNKEIKYNQSQEVKVLKGETLESMKIATDLLEKEEKAEKRKIVINNLQKKKYIDILMVKANEDSDKFYSAMQKKGSKYKQLVQDHLSIFLDNITEYDEDDLTDKDLLTEVMKFVKISNGKLNDVLPSIIHYNNLFVKNDKVDKENRDFLKFVNDKLLRIAYKVEFKEVEKIDSDNKITEERLKEITEQKKKLSNRITYIEFGRDENKPLKLKYNELKQQEKAREGKVISEIEKIKKLKDTNPEKAIEDAKELKDELLEMVEKLKQQQQQKPVKPIKKSEEEKQEDITNADVTNRLEHIKTLPVAGKPLETYLSGNGQVILQYSTGDYSKVYDNEFNEEIPNYKVTLNNGKVESLRKAVTIDLYSDKNVYEIKNYSQYSINDIIPLQETKIEGTGYFKPLYFQNGKLYNIQLNYTDPETGQELSKYILPENEEGRTLNVIYRLKEGLFELKPMDLDQVETKLSKYKSIGGKNLYLFEKSNLDPCLDHYNNPSYNIQPFLRPIKLGLKK